MNIYNLENKNPIPVENSFNAIRLLMCLIIIYGHSLCFSNSTFYFNLIPDLHIPVCLFFILSGFWVTKSYLSKTSENNHLKIYYFKRLKKIFPLYIFTVLFFSIICVFFSELSPLQYFTSKEYLKYLFCNLITLNFLAENLPGCFNGMEVNGSLWTIKIELFFYIVLPLVILILNKLKNKKMTNLILITVTICSSTFFSLFADNQAVPSFLQKIANQFPGYFGYFTAGMLILFNWDNFIKYEKFLIVPAILLFILHFLTRTEILLPFSLTCILFFVGKRFLIFKNIGHPIDYSYGMYLVHFPLVRIFTQLHFFESSKFIGFIVVLTTSFALTYFMENFIQKKIN